MRNLEEWIADWRKTMLARPPVRHETLDELENHLRETVDQLVWSGMTEAEAFQRAATQLGGARSLAAEFQKLDQGTWLPVKVIITIAILGALGLAVLLVSRYETGRSTLLLASHVFTVTVGYTTTLLVGALGICFVGQRCFSELAPSRARSVTRATFFLGCVAAGLTVVGVVLGMIWAKAEWGRYWAWDIKEIGGLAVILWQACFLLAHGFVRGHARNVLVMSLVGNIVVILAWFGGNLVSRLHVYGTGSYGLLLAGAVVGNLGLLWIGLAPAGWLRPGKGS